MDKYIVLVFCVILAVSATATRTKGYRKDYVYDWRTDAFYKLHIESLSERLREEVCEEEGAKLMSPMSYEELTQYHAKLNQNQFAYTEEDDDYPRRDSAEVRSIFDSLLEAKDVLEMTCQVTTRDGYVKTTAVYQNQPFICKVEAKDIPYDSQCRLHAKGYKFIPSIGSCYKISSEKQTWDTAAAQCQGEGAHLAVINTKEEAEVLKKLTNSAISSQVYVHIGFRVLKNTEPRVFKTIFNQTLDETGFSSWATGEPNNLNNAEYCGSLHTGEAKLNDNGCHSHYFICEKEVICECKP